jgi:hypothetical protein
LLNADRSDAAARACPRVLMHACAANACVARTVCYLGQLLSAASTAATAATAAATAATAAATAAAALPTGSAAARVRQRVRGPSAGRADLYGQQQGVIHLQRIGCGDGSGSERCDCGCQ